MIALYCDRHCINHGRRALVAVVYSRGVPPQTIRSGRRPGFSFSSTSIYTCGPGVMAELINLLSPLVLFRKRSWQGSFIFAGRAYRTHPLMVASARGKNFHVKVLLVLEIFFTYFFFFTNRMFSSCLFQVSSRVVYRASLREGKKVAW